MRFGRCEGTSGPGWRIVLGAAAFLAVTGGAMIGPPKGDRSDRANKQADAPPVHVDPGPSPTLGAKPPALDDRTRVLFDGKRWIGWIQRDRSLSQWAVQDDGSVLVRNGDAVTVQSFADHQIHLEFFCPLMPDHAGQARANSGVYVHGRYEVQILDTFGQDPFMGGCGAIYSISPPMVNASRPPGTWQTYDIIFLAPRFDDAGNLARSAFITVLHNGIVIHNNLELPHTTPGGLKSNMVPSGPLLIQDHGDPLRFRNIWVRQLG